MIHRLIKDYVLYNAKNSPVDIFDYMIDVLNYNPAQASIVYMMVLELDEGED